MSEERKYPICSHEEYTGYTNEEVKKLRKAIREIKAETNKELEKLEAKLKPVQAELKAIQDDCIHHHKKSGNGPYETYYTCSICGYEKDSHY